MLLLRKRFMIVGRDSHIAPYDRAIFVYRGAAEDRVGNCYANNKKIIIAKSSPIPDVPI